MVMPVLRLLGSRTAASVVCLRDHPGLVVPPGPHHGRVVVRLLGRGRGEGGDEEDPRRGPPPAWRSNNCELLIAAKDDLAESDVDLRVIEIGDETAAKNFFDFISLDPARLRIDPRGDLHRELGLPGGIPEDDGNLRPAATAWMIYLAMCAGIGAPGTLREILRGYFGDKMAPEQFREDDVVTAGFTTIRPGVGPVEVGPLSYRQWFADERGYHRPVKLAAVWLKNMVSDPATIALRGATYLFDEDGQELYGYKSRGVLTYSETMARPLTFLAPYIGEDVARNPMGTKDDRGGDLVCGRGALKPAGKAMGILSMLFKLENKLQVQLLGATEDDYAAARKSIDDATLSHRIVVYTYGLSPFSSEALAVLDEAGDEYENVEV
ncbi:hypothetical protein ACHAWF_014703 [Thalassiosira exigua]